MQRSSQKIQDDGSFSSWTKSIMISVLDNFSKFDEESLSTLQIFFQSLAYNAENDNMFDQKVTNELNEKLGKWLLNSNNSTKSCLF